jgi:hypothetical protein
VAALAGGPLVVVNFPPEECATSFFHTKRDTTYCADIFLLREMKSPLRSIKTSKR